MLLYSTFFARSAATTTSPGGVVAGAVHALLGGLVVGAFVDLHPAMPDEVPAPGVFCRHYGRRDVTTFLAGHLLFGLLAGVGYAFLHGQLPPSAAW